MLFRSGWTGLTETECNYYYKRNLWENYFGNYKNYTAEVYCDNITVKGKVNFTGNFQNVVGASSKIPLNATKVSIYGKDKTGDSKVGTVMTDHNGYFEQSIYCPDPNIEFFFEVEASNDYSTVRENLASNAIKFTSDPKRASNKVVDFGDVEATPGGAFNIVKNIDRGVSFWMLSGEAMYSN